MTIQSQPQPVHSFSKDAHAVIFPSHHAPSAYCSELAPEAELELLYLGSETLIASLNKWKEERGRCKPASEAKTMNDAMMTIEAVDTVIRCLEGLIPKAEKKPLLPNLRLTGWFAIGDPIVSRLVDSRNNYYIRKHDYGVDPDDWARYASMPRYTGTVVKHDDGSSGVVALSLDGAPFPGHHLEYIDYCPFVLHHWEYDYLRANLEFFYFWCRFSHGDARPDLETLILG